MVCSYFADLNTEMRQVTSFAFLTLYVLFLLLTAKGNTFRQYLLSESAKQNRVSKTEMVCLFIPALRSKAEANITKGAWFIFPQQSHVGSLAG